ncbi:MAG: DUF4221 family protein [Saprospiraceae bacterium]|nr:DUF4221 family protein [Saprospiraceae bacterium]
MRVNQKSILSKVILLSLFFSYACTSSSDSEERVSISEMNISKNKYQLIPTDTLQIKVDSMAKVDNYLYKLYENAGESWFTDYDEGKRSIHFYSLTDLKKTKEVKLNEDGPNAIEDPENYYVHNLDSIFTISYESGMIYLINDKGELKNKWKVDYPLPNHSFDYEIGASVNFTFEYSYSKQTIHFSVIPSLNANEQAYFEHPLIAELNLSTKKIMHYYAKYPMMYQKRGLFTTLDEVGMAVTPQFDIVYFMASPNLYLYNSDNKELLKIINAKSKYAKKEIEPITKFGTQPELNQQRKYYIEADVYDKVLFHNKHPYIYRIIKLGSEFKTLEGTITQNDDFSYSVMIFTKDFELVNEVLLPKHTYKPNIVLLTEKGLLLSLNNGKNPSHLEDMIQFAVLEPQKL